VKAARKTLELTDRKRVIAAFVHLVHTTESLTVLKLAANKLGTFDPGNKSAIAALLLLMKQAKFIPWSEICSLGKIGYNNEAVISTLIQFIKMKPDEIINYCLIKPDEITNYWFTLEEIYQSAILALGKIAYGNLIAIASLIDFIRRYKDDVISLHTAKALWDIDPGNAIALNTLVQILETTETPSLLDMSVAYLMAIDPGNKAAITILTERIKTSENEFFRCRAALRLRELNSGNRVAITTPPLTLLTPVVENKRTFCQTSQNFEEIPVGDENAIASLVETIETTLSEEINFFAIMDLGKIAVGNPTAIASLIKFLQINQGDAICFDAAQALWQIDPGNSVALKSLAYILETSASPSLINRVVTYLLKIDPESKTGIVISNRVATIILSQILETTQYQASEDEYLLDIAETLTNILQSEHSPEVVIALKDYLSEPHYKKSSYRYDAVFNIIWHCAENMTYPDFYKAMN
jgi:HEAT repeat protein